MSKLPDLISWLTKRRWQTTSSTQKATPLQEEIEHLEKYLASTSPHRRPPTSLEVQKMIDLAG